jgi:hypothetical protein
MKNKVTIKRSYGYKVIRFWKPFGKIKISVCIYFYRQYEFAIWHHVVTSGGNGNKST